MYLYHMMCKIHSVCPLPYRTVSLRMIENMLEAVAVFFSRSSFCGICELPPFEPGTFFDVRFIHGNSLDVKEDEREQAGKEEEEEKKN